MLGFQRLEMEVIPVSIMKVWESQPYSCLLSGVISKKEISFPSFFPIHLWWRWWGHKSRRASPATVLRRAGLVPNLGSIVELTLMVGARMSWSWGFEVEKSGPASCLPCGDMGKMHPSPMPLPLAMNGRQESWPQGQQSWRAPPTPHLGSTVEPGLDVVFLWASPEECGSANFIIHKN